MARHCSKVASLLITWKQLQTYKVPIVGGQDCAKVTKTPSHGETFNVGGIKVKALHTPCHTQDSICYFFEDGDDRALFTGDTLFIGGMTCFLQPLHGHERANGVAGCGRFFEGTPEEMDKALNTTLAALPDDTKVYVRRRTPSILASPLTNCISRATSTQKATLSSASRSRKMSRSRSSSLSRITTSRRKGSSRSVMRRSIMSSCALR